MSFRNSDRRRWKAKMKNSVFVQFTSKAWHPKKWRWRKLGILGKGGWTRRFYLLITGINYSKSCLWWRFYWFCPLMVLQLFTDNIQKHFPLYMVSFLAQGLQSQVGPFVEWMDIDCLDRQLLWVGITTTTAELLLDSTARVKCWSTSSISRIEGLEIQGNHLNHLEFWLHMFQL